MKKIAIIGASIFQLPLIKKAKEMGLETHVFAWKTGDVGEFEADYFYPVSITDCEEIYQICRNIKIDGICTIGTDLGTIPVSYVASKMGLVANSIECVNKSTNKHLMRKSFEEQGVPSPKSILINNKDDIDKIELKYPVICKPTDRSGSRGIFKVSNKKQLLDVIDISMEYSFEKKALVEEFVEGQEYSIEYITYAGKHIFLAMTKKYTTGAPNFIEIAHVEPAPILDNDLQRVKNTVEHALDSLGITNGASHSEIKIDKNGTIKIIEIGARMGGDFIGSHLVELSTGVDYVKNVIDVSLGQKPKTEKNSNKHFSAVRFILNPEDLEVYSQIQRENPDIIIEKNIEKITNRRVVDSSSRFGYYILKTDTYEEIYKWLPHNNNN